MKHHPKGKKGPMGSGAHTKSMKKSARAGVAIRKAPKGTKGSLRKGKKTLKRGTPTLSIPKSIPKNFLGKGYHGGKKITFKKLAKKGRTALGTVLDSGAKTASDPDTRAAMSIAGALISKKKSRRKRGIKSGLALAFQSL